MKLYKKGTRIDLLASYIELRPLKHFVELNMYMTERMTDTNFKMQDSSEYR